MANGSRLDGSEWHAGIPSWHSKPKSGEDTEMDSDTYWFKADPNKAWRRTGPRRRPRRKEAPATAEEAAARPPSDSERSVLAPLLSSSRGRVRRYYVVLRSSLNYYSLRF